MKMDLKKGKESIKKIIKKKKEKRRKNSFINKKLLFAPG